MSRDAVLYDCCSGLHRGWIAAAVKKTMLAVFLGIGVFGTACMFFIQQGNWLLGSVLFVVANQDSVEPQHDFDTRPG